MIIDNITNNKVKTTKMSLFCIKCRPKAILLHFYYYFHGNGNYRFYLHKKTLSGQSHHMCERTYNNVTCGRIIKHQGIIHK